MKKSYKDQEKRTSQLGENSKRAGSIESRTARNTSPVMQRRKTETLQQTTPVTTCRKREETRARQQITQIRCLNYRPSSSLKSARCRRVCRQGRVLRQHCWRWDYRTASSAPPAAGSSPPQRFRPCFSVSALLYPCPFQFRDYVSERVAAMAEERSCTAS